MAEPSKIEDIEEMRRLAGIDDVDLRMAIRRLKPGDLVQLTVSSDARPNQTALVRITRIRGSAFSGKIARKMPGSRIGDLVKFTTANIHSVIKKESTPARTVPRNPAAEPQLLTLEERLHRIETLGNRIRGHIDAIARIAHEPGTSPDGKERAVKAFHEKIILVESELGRIREELQME